MTQKTVKLWRVVSRDGSHGPFNTYDFAAAFATVHANDNDAFPNALGDIGELPEGWLHACQSVTLLRQWFAHRELVESLKARGFRISCVAVAMAHVRIGRRQAIFDPRHAHVRALYPVTALPRPLKDWKQL